MAKLAPQEITVMDQPWFKYAIYGLTALLYFTNFGTNAIWTPNESFYAEAVREMFESGNYLEFFYNYEPRFNKPPLTYWLIASSVILFGLNEWAIRLPIVLLAYLTNFAAAGIAGRLYGPKASLWTFITMAFSFQFVGNKQYASPETPLTFFFTLCMLLFVIAWQSRNKWWLFLAFVTLGFTVLVKGYPYFIVIGAIITLFVLFYQNWQIKNAWKELRFFIHIPGILISLLIGLSWIIYMNSAYGEAFQEVLNAETINRAVGKKPFSWEDPFFYPAVISWSFLPYSLAFYLALILIVRSKKWREELALPLAWFFAMLLIFTISSGKIPTYFIQAHPAMAIMVAWVFVNPDILPNRKWKIAWNVSLLFPAILLFASGIALVIYLNLSRNWLEIPLVIALLIGWLSYRAGKENTIRLIPFMCVFVPLFIFSLAVLPQLEKYRPYKEIGTIINQSVPTASTPIYMQDRILHNLPFYAKRKMIRDASKEELVNSYNTAGELLALVKTDTWQAMGSPEPLWNGYIYEKTSESRFAIFVRAHIQAEQGNMEAFEMYYLAHKKQNNISN